MNKDRNNPNKIFAQNLQECLRVKDWDQQTFARYMGVSVSSVSQWIRGLKMPRMPKIDKMCQLFNCSRSDLLEEHGPDDERGELYAALLQHASSMTSLFAEAGVDLAVIAARLGHHDSKLTRDIYMHRTKALQKKYNDAVRNVSIL